MPDVALAQRLLNLLGSIPAERLPLGAAGTIRSLEDAVERNLERPLVVCLAGPTGTGKSRLFNAAVGRDVRAVGIRRPTTTDVGLAGREVAELPDVEVAEAPFDHIALIDLPPLEHDQDRTERIVALSDLCFVVTSAARYADAATATAIAIAERLGVPATIVVNRVPPGVPPDRLRQALIQRHGRRDVVLLPEDPAGRISGEPSGIAELLHLAVENADRIRRYRHDAAIDAAAIEAGRIADELDVEAASARQAIESIDRELARRSVPEALRPIIAGARWSEAMTQVDAAVRHEAAAVLAGLDVEPQADGDDGVVALGAWRQAVDDAAVGAMRLPVLRWFGERGVRHHLWRLAVDVDRPMPRTVRWWLGSRADAIRGAAADEFDAVFGGMLAGRIEPIRDDLERTATLPTDRIRSVADEILAEAYPTALFRLTPDIAALQAAAEAGIPFEGDR